MKIEFIGLVSRFGISNSDFGLDYETSSETKANQSID